jgi:hypothetical protein
VSPAVHAGARNGRSKLAAPAPADNRRTWISTPEVVFADSLREWAIVLAASALGITWVLAPVIAGPSLLDYLWAVLVGLPFTALVAPRAVRRALRVSRESISAGPDGIDVRGEDGDSHLPWRAVARFRPVVLKDRVVVAIDLVDRSSLLVGALGVRTYWTQWARRRGSARVAELCRELEGMRPSRGRPLPSFELAPQATAPRDGGWRKFAVGAVVLTVLAWGGDIPRHDASAAGVQAAAIWMIVAGAIGALIGATALVRIHSRRTAVEGAALATLAMVLGMGAVLVGALR